MVVIFVSLECNPYEDRDKIDGWMRWDGMRWDGMDGQIDR